MQVEIDYEINGRRSSGSGLEGLKSQGWWPTYRVPQGIGIERRAKFSTLDMTVATDVACRCSAGSGVEEGDSRRMALRFRWKKGEMPEVSTSVVGNGKRKVLSPSIVYGHLITYDFESDEPYPGGRAGRCGARMVLSILGDPPIL